MTYVTPENDYRRILDRISRVAQDLTDLYTEVSQIAGFTRQPVENLRAGWRVRWEGEWRRIGMTGKTACGEREIVFDPEGDPNAVITVVFNLDDMLDVSLETDDLVEPF